MNRRDDAVRDYLRLRGAASHVVSGGLDGLLDAWERTVEQIEVGYPFTLDDYLNDLDTRDLLAGAIEKAPGAEAARNRLAAADTRLRAMLIPTEACLWGEGVAEDEGWSRHTHWWYFGRPRNPGPDLAEDLGLDG